MIQRFLIGVIFAWLLCLSIIIMRVSAPVTDYIRASTMNTKGDLVVRGDLVPERLTAGLVNTFFRGKGAGEIPAYENLGEVLDTYLKAQGAGVDPIFEKLALRDTGIKIGNSTRSAAGNQVISGVGFQASIIFFIANESDSMALNMSWGADDGITHLAVAEQLDGILQTSVPNFSLYISASGGNILKGYVSDIGSDGFTINWELIGTKRINYIYICLP